MKITIEIPDEVWVCKIKLPQQKHCNEFEQVEVFRTEQAAKTYMERECRRIATNIVTRVKPKKYAAHLSEYDYEFHAEQTNGDQWEIRGGIYKKTINN